MAFRFFGLFIEEWTFDQIENALAESILSGVPKAFLNVNVHAINLAFENPSFYKALQRAEFIFCDGEGVRLACNWQGAKIPHRITYADWMPRLLPWLASQGFSVYFLGARPEVMEQTQKIVRYQFPNLNLCGASHGYGDLELALEDIRDKKPDMLILGLGMPKQELFIDTYRHSLPVKVFLSGGAVFDYVSGLTPRAPIWMQKLKLEWLFRFLLEPRRMFKRYMIGNPLFVWRVFRGSTPN